MKYLNINIHIRLIALLSMLSFTALQCIAMCDREKESTLLSYFSTLTRQAQEEHVTRSNLKGYRWYREATPDIVYKRSMLILTDPPIPRHGIKLGLDQKTLTETLSEVQKRIDSNKKYHVYSDNDLAYYNLNTVGLLSLVLMAVTINPPSTMHSPSPKKRYLCRFFMKQPNTLVKRINNALGDPYFPIYLLVPHALFTLFRSLVADLKKSPLQSHINGPKACMYYVLLSITQQYANDVLRAIKKTYRRKQVHQKQALEMSTITPLITTPSAIDTDQANILKSSGQKKSIKANTVQEKLTIKKAISNIFTLSFFGRLIKTILAAEMATRYETY